MYYKRWIPTEWKKCNVVPLHKKNSKQSLKNYRPVSLLLVFDKIFDDRIINNNIFECVTAKNLISPNHLGFKLGDSCIKQLLSMIHEIYQPFDNVSKFEVCFLT